MAVLRCPHPCDAILVDVYETTARNNESLKKRGVESICLECGREFDANGKPIGESAEGEINSTKKKTPNAKIRTVHLKNGKTMKVGPRPIQPYFA